MMDTSAKYTEMCKKAEEIQKQVDWQDIYNVYHGGEDIGFVDGFMLPQEQSDEEPMGHFVHWTKNGEKETVLFPLSSLTWLPRQDQLQAMVTANGESAPYTLTLQFSRAVCGGSASYPPGFDSMEQLWLAYVMAEKYRKVWSTTKKDWVRED